MSWMLAGAGAFIVALTLLDFVWTALSLRGAGPITKHVSRAIWFMFRHGPRLGRPHLLSATGPCILFGTVAGWALLIWLGWFLIFAAGERAVLVTPAMQPADVWGRLYFAGFTISTLGVGDLAPGGPVWQALTAIGALNGLIVITAGITYLLAVLSAVVEMRQMASYVSSLGNTSEDLVICGWDGQSFKPLQDHLANLTPQVLANVQQQLAYPILHYFHSSEPSTAAAPALAVLNEALTILEHGVAPQLRLPNAAPRPLRTAIASLLHNATPGYLRLAEQAPPAPDLQQLRAAGIGTVADEEFHRVLELRSQRRRLLLAMVRHEAWSWDAIRAGVGCGKVSR